MKIEIPFRLPGYNEHDNKSRANMYAAAAEKKNWTNSIAWIAKGHKQIETKVNVRIVWGLNWSSIDRRDPDNIASSIKFVLDGLVLGGVLKNDTRRYIGSITHEFDEKANKTFIYLDEAITEV